jgi:hypothetical protein
MEEYGKQSLFGEYESGHKHRKIFFFALISSILIVAILVFFVTSNHEKAELSNMKISKINKNWEKYLFERVQVTGMVLFDYDYGNPMSHYFYLTDMSGDILVFGTVPKGHYYSLTIIGTILFGGYKIEDEFHLRSENIIINR